MHRDSSTSSSIEADQEINRAESTSTRDIPRRFLVIVLVAMFFVAWFGNLDHRKLTRPDEGRYAEIAREMAAAGDWITPRLNGIKYFEKPPLQYWVTAGAFRLFGEHEWTARLWPAVTGLGLVLLVLLAGRRLFGPAAGLYSALVLGGSVAHVVAGHVNTLDMGLTFFMTATLLAFLLAQHAGPGTAEGRNWILSAWACAALAVLSKGLIGMVLPAAVLAVYGLAHRDFGLLRGLRWGGGIALFIVVAAPWFVAIQNANPEFARFFFVHEHLERFLTETHLRARPWWYFFPVLAAGMLPWLTLLPQALLRGWRSRQSPGAFQPTRVLVIWAVVIFAFFAASGSKLMSYILPIFPALALLTGLVLAETGPRQLLLHTIPLVIAGIAIMAISAGTNLPGIEDTVPDLRRAYVPWIAASGLVLAMGSVCALIFCRLGRRTAALLGLSFGGLIATQLVIAGHDTLAPSYSGHHLARDIRRHLAHETPLYSVGTYDQTLPFYLKRTMTLVAFKGELAYGLAQEPELWLPDIASFERAWRSAPRPLAVMEPPTFAELEQRGLPMRIVARDLRRIVVGKPGAGP